MKKILIFAVDTASGKEFCSIYQEDVDSILNLFSTIDDWARYIYAGCKFVKVKSTVVVDFVRIDYDF